MLEVRVEALGAAWVVTRAGGRGSVRRRDPDGAEHELARSERRLGVDRVGLAAAVLTDALGATPSHRLAADPSVFLVPAEPEGERSMTGRELQAWLATWKAPFDKIFPIAARASRRARR